MANGTKWAVGFAIGLAASVAGNALQFFAIVPAYHKIFEEKIVIEGKVTDTHSEIVNGTVYLYSGAEIDKTNTKSGKYEFKGAPKKRSYLIKVVAHDSLSREKYYHTTSPREGKLEYDPPNFPAHLGVVKGLVRSSSAHKPIEENIQIWAGGNRGSMYILPNSGGLLAKYIVKSIECPRVPLLAKIGNKIINQEDVSVCPHVLTMKQIVIRDE